MQSPVLGILNLPTLLTLLGVSLGMGAVVFAYDGQLAAAVICLMYSGLCDLFDGVVARRVTLSEREQAYGVQIDSLADMASFGVVPPVVLMLLGLDAWPAMIAYTLCAATRLAWFNLEAAGPVRPTHYTGLPVTYAALLLPIILLFCTNAHMLTLTWPAQLALWGLAGAFVLKVPVPRPRPAAYVFFVLLAVVMTVVWAGRITGAG